MAGSPSMRGILFRLLQTVQAAQLCFWKLHPKGLLRLSQLRCLIAACEISFL